MSRLDQAIVAAGLTESRARAQALIEAGVVLVNGMTAPRQVVLPRCFWPMEL